MAVQDSSTQTAVEQHLSTAEALKAELLATLLQHATSLDELETKLSKSFEEFKNLQKELMNRQKELEQLVTNAVKDVEDFVQQMLKKKLETSLQALLNQHAANSPAQQSNDDNAPKECARSGDESGENEEET